MPNPLTFLGSDDFQQLIARLGARGPAWPRDLGSVQMRAWGAVADIIARFHARAADLSERESDPAQTIELLPDWERAWGLPDPCVPGEQTVAQRRDALLAKMATLGGQSRAYFIAVAARLGYAITIDELHSFRADESCADDPCYGPDWDFVWQVNAPAVTIRYFEADGSFADEPLEVFGNDALECVINALKPAHTIVLFAYGP